MLLCAVALVAAGCGGDDDSGSTTQKKKPAATAPAEDQQQAQCKDVDQPPPREDGGPTRPKRPLDASKTYEVEFQTSCGSFTIRLAQRISPNAAASFASLARSGFFDDTIFHSRAT